MEFTTMDNEVLIHHTDIWCMEGYGNGWWGDSPTNEYFNANGRTYPKHFIKNVRVLYEYTTIEVSNKLMQRDSYHAEPYFGSDTTRSIKKHIADGLIKIIHDEVAE